VAAPAPRRAWRRGPAAERDASAHPDAHGCGLSVDERSALAALERGVARGDPAFALRLSGVRGGRLRAALVSRAGTALGASLLAVGTVGSLWSTWFVLVLAVGAVPALADMVETRRIHRRHREHDAR
jgi:Protein of unknown function (DUF3040)